MREPADRPGAEPLRRGHVSLRPWSWWRRRRWELAQQQLLAGKPGDVALEELAQQNPLFAGTANEHRFLRRLSRAETRTEWRGD